MPTEKAYKKLIEACKEIENLGLNAFETDFTITDNKTKKETDFKIKIKLHKIRRE